MVEMGEIQHPRGLHGYNFVGFLVGVCYYKVVMKL